MPVPVITAVIVAALLTLAGCSGGRSGAPATPVVLTGAQAQQLSLARFTTYQLGTLALRAEFTMNGTAITLDGWADYVTHVGYAESSENGEPRNLLMWNYKKIALKQLDGTVPTPLLPQPDLDSTWGTASINTSASELQQILIVILSLGNDRPDNALLVAQNGARFLRIDHIGGAPMNVYAVPPAPAGPATQTTQVATPDVDVSDQRTIDYWINAAGAIQKVEFTLASGSDVAVSLTTGDAPQLHDPFPVAGDGT